VNDLARERFRLAAILCKADHHDESVCHAIAQLFAARGAEVNLVVHTVTSEADGSGRFAAV
jgi:hypothetical protein